MSTLSWNSRGLGNPCTVCSLQRALHTKAPQLVFLMKTKLSQEDMKYKKQELGYPQGLAVSSIGQSGGLAVGTIMETKNQGGNPRIFTMAYRCSYYMCYYWCNLAFNWLLWAARHKQKGRNMVHLGITWPNKPVTLALYQGPQ